MVHVLTENSRLSVNGACADRELCTCAFVPMKFRRSEAKPLASCTHTQRDREKMNHIHTALIIHTISYIIIVRLS